MSQPGAGFGPDLPDPRRAAAFHFRRCGYDPASGVASLAYAFDDGPELVERITFPHAPWPPDASRQAALMAALELLHGIAGVSYYKAGLCPELRFEAPVAPAHAAFLRRLYVRGLAEFGHVNGLDVAARVRFEPGAPPAAEHPRALVLPQRALVAMGGGKDSLVALRLLREAAVEAQPVCVGNSPLIRDTVRAAGMPLLQIGRELAPELAAINRAGAWNGHVPVTAINSAIGVCAALLYGYEQVVFANERSADEATLVDASGRAVNHQYSKSSAFEADFRRRLVEAVSPDLEYYSILRPWSELGVLKRFAGLSEFHGVFSSCNRHFHLDGARVAGRWCRDCPKCRFVALGLAVFLPPQALSAIQGGDLLDDVAQLEGFRALCALGRDKPFECVGEAGESRAALAALAERPEWRRHAVVRALAPELAGQEVPGLDALLAPRARHFIPSAIAGRLGLPEAADEPA